MSPFPSMLECWLAWACTGHHSCGELVNAVPCRAQGPLFHSGYLWPLSPQPFCPPLSMIASEPFAGVDTGVSLVTGHFSHLSSTLWPVGSLCIDNPASNTGRNFSDEIWELHLTVGREVGIEKSVGYHVHLAIIIVVGSLLGPASYPTMGSCQYLWHHACPFSHGAGP